MLFQAKTQSGDCLETVQIKRIHFLARSSPIHKLRSGKEKTQPGLEHCFTDF